MAKIKILIGALVLILALGYLGLRLYLLDMVKVMNRTTKSAHVEASVPGGNWQFNLSPGTSRRLWFKAEGDCDMTLNVRYEDGMTTTLGCGYFTSGIGEKYSCFLN